MRGVERGVDERKCKREWSRCLGRCRTPRASMDLLINRSTAPHVHAKTAAHYTLPGSSCSKPAPKRHAAADAVSFVQATWGPSLWQQRRPCSGNFGAETKPKPSTRQQHLKSTTMARRTRRCRRTNILRVAGLASLGRACREEGVGRLHPLTPSLATICLQTAGCNTGIPLTQGPAREWARSLAGTIKGTLPCTNERQDSGVMPGWFPSRASVSAPAGASAASAQLVDLCAGRRHANAASELQPQTARTLAPGRRVT